MKTHSPRTKGPPILRTRELAICGDLRAYHPANLAMFYLRVGTKWRTARLPTFADSRRIARREQRRLKFARIADLRP
jgi:hypothetical protein